MKDVAVVAYCRTGIAQGATRGALNQTHGIPMTAHVLRNAVERAGIDPAEVEDVVVGCGLPEGATGHNIARNAALEAGFGDGVPGMTDQPLLRLGAERGVDRRQPDRRRRGRRSRSPRGVESISLVQFNLNLNGFFYEPLQQRMPAVWWTMNQTADFVAKKYGISREAQDAYVVREPAARRRGGGRRQVRRGDRAVHDHDEGDRQGDQGEPRAGGHARSRRGPAPRHHARRPRGAEARLSRAARRPPATPRSSPTAPAAVVMMDADLAARRGLPILGLFRGMQLAAVAPEEMSIAIAPAIRKLMKHHALAMADVDLWELHEAYAVTTLYNQAQLETPWEITNVNGGAVRARPSVRHVGHPLPRLDAARARAPRRPARGRRRVHGGRHGDRRVPRAGVITRRRRRAATGRPRRADACPGGSPRKPSGMRSPAFASPS